MFGSRKETNPLLEKNIDIVLIEMAEIGADHPDYPALMIKLERLYKLRELHSEEPKRVSPDVLFTVAGNLACVLVIVMYEKRNVVTSKAMTFVARLTGRASS